MGRVLFALFLVLLPPLLAIVLLRNAPDRREQDDIVVISGATGGVGTALRRLYPSQRVVTISRAPIPGDPYNFVVDYSNLPGFGAKFEKFMAEKCLPMGRVTEYHSLHGYGIISDFASLTPAKIDDFLQVNVYSHVYLTNYFIKLASVRRISLVSSLSHHAPTAGLQLYQASKAFVEQFATGLILERPDVCVVCAVPAAIRGTQFETRAEMSSASRAFLRLYGPCFSTTPERVATVLARRKSGVYRVGWLVHVCDLARGAVGTNLWARALRRVNLAPHE